jgi:hypothetical protein
MRRQLVQRPASRYLLAAVLLFPAAGCGRRATLSRLPLLTQTPEALLLWSEPFDVLNPERWREVEVKRHTRYETVLLDGRSCLKAESRDGASILVAQVHFDPDTYEWLSWEWRVDQLVEKEALDRKDGADAAARVYVYFESVGLPWQKRNIDYVWSASLPVGTILTSPYASSSKVIVVESGSSSVGRWKTVERNLEEDYKRCFGGRLPPVVAIGIMSDTDNTHGAALTYFDEVRISRAGGQ